MTAQPPKRRRGGSLTRKVATRQSSESVSGDTAFYVVTTRPDGVGASFDAVNRDLIRQALADSEAVWHDGWRSHADPGVLVIPVDVAADVIVGLLQRCFTESGSE